MMFHKTKLAIALALTVTLGATSFALADGKPNAADKAAFHAKHAEMKAKRLAQFDTNKDGKLDDQERAAMQDTQAAERFKKLDTNNDGQISLAEWKAGKAGKEHGGHHGRRGHHDGAERGARTK